MKNQSQEYQQTTRKIAAAILIIATISVLVIMFRGYIFRTPSANGAHETTYKTLTVSVGEKVYSDALFDLYYGGYSEYTYYTAYCLRFIMCDSDAYRKIGVAIEYPIGSEQITFRFRTFEVVKHSPNQITLRWTE